MARFYWDRDAHDWVEVPLRRVRESIAPAVWNDIRSYACPITGREIGSRSTHRDNLRQHGCRVIEPDEARPVLFGKDYAGNKLYNPDRGQEVQRELDQRRADTHGYERAAVTTPGVPA